MKQTLTEDQLKTLLNQSEWKNCKQQGPREFFIKSDTYYSFNGEMLSNPKRVVRIRRNNFLFGLDSGKALECDGQLGRWVKDKNDKSEFQVFPVKYQYKSNEIDSFVREKFFDFTIQHSTGDSTIDLTIKNKRTDSSGIETNDELECGFGESGLPVIEELLKTTNFLPYFKKEKRSVSWYVILNGYSLHLEVVSVNGCIPYLEIEVILPDSDKGHAEKVQNTIKEFFLSNLGITTFDGRSWNQIINAAK